MRYNTAEAASSDRVDILKNASPVFDVCGVREESNKQAFAPLPTAAMALIRFGGQVNCVGCVDLSYRLRLQSV